MKVAVITRHAITNYGSLLQAMATQKVIEALGHSCEIINYIRNDESYAQIERTLLKKKKTWNNNALKKALYLAVRQPESIAAGKRFEKARAQYLNLTRKYTAENELRQDKPEADVYMTGSDQVWGPVADGCYDNAYCLSFVNDADKKVSYAASFGHTEMTEEWKASFKMWLQRYRYLAVREDSAVEILGDLGLNAFQVLDPTLLLDADAWGQYLKPIPVEKYVLVYQLHNDKRLGEYAQRVAKKKGLPLIRVSASFHQITREGKLVWAPDLGAFLSFIKNADCMITDSFHGTAFAINFNTPFVEVLPNNNTGTRNMSILKLTGLSERILRDAKDLSLADKQIDFENANKILQKKRTESLEILRKMIEM